jgi:hypothetical protein
MSLGALYQADIDKALDLSAALPATPPPKPSRGIWATVGDSLRGAGARINASLLEAGNVVGAAATIDINTEESLEVLKGDPDRIFRENDLSRQFREFERTLRPDPATASTAEQVVYGLVGPAASLVGGALLGGLPGVGLVSAEMGFSESENLAREGVSLGARSGVGAVTTAVNTAFAALPMMGSSLKTTAGLYLTGGPGAFIAQQSASRAILEAADYSTQAQQYDPFDPTGLALSFLIPAPFAAVGAARNIRANRAAAAGSDPAVSPSAADVGTKQPAAAAPEQVDAAMTHNLTLMRQAQDEALPELMARPAMPEQIEPQTVPPPVEPAPVPDVAAAVYGPDFSTIEGSADSAVRNVATGLRQAATDARDIGTSLMRAVDEFRAMRERGDSPDTLGDRNLPPDVNNVVVGLVENARSPARVAELVRQLATATREAKANKAPTADAAADVVERMRKVLDSQVEATAKPSVEPMLKSINDRVTALEVTTPDLPVRVDDSGKVTTAKEEMAAARKEAAEGTDEDIGLNEVDLVRVAAECALASGAY